MDTGTAETPWRVNKDTLKPLQEMLSKRLVGKRLRVTTPAGIYEDRLTEGHGEPPIKCNTQRHTGVCTMYLNFEIRSFSFSNQPGRQATIFIWEDHIVVQVEEFNAPALEYQFDVLI